MYPCILNLIYTSLPRLLLFCNYANSPLLKSYLFHLYLMRNYRFKTCVMIWFHVTWQFQSNRIFRQIRTRENFICIWSEVQVFLINRFRICVVMIWFRVIWQFNATGFFDQIKISENKGFTLVQIKVDWGV